MFKSFILIIFFTFSLLINPMVNAKEVMDTETVVNINTASAKEMQKMLVGIGEVKSKAIVKFREKNGKFANVDSLAEVRGISARLVEKNRDKIVF